MGSTVQEKFGLFFAGATTIDKALILVLLLATVVALSFGVIVYKLQRLYIQVHSKDMKIPEKLVKRDHEFAIRAIKQ